MQETKRVEDKKLQYNTVIKKLKTIIRNKWIRKRKDYQINYFIVQKLVLGTVRVKLLITVDV